MNASDESAHPEWRLLWLAPFAALVGVAALTAWFTSGWPPTAWTVLPRSQMLEKGRQVAQHFASNRLDSKGFAVTSFARSLAHYRDLHPGDANARAVSPLSMRITFATGPAGKVAEVGLDSAGVPIYWRAPEDYKPAQSFASPESAATAAFQFMAGSQAGKYREAVHSAGEEKNQEEYVWKQPPVPHSEMRDNVKVVTNGSVVQSVEHKTYLASDDDDNSDEGGYWSILSGIFGLLCTVGTVVIFGFYILWLVRRAMNHTFPLRLAGAVLLVMVAVSLTGSGWDRMRTVHPDSGSGTIGGAVLLAAIILCFVAVGRGISAAARPKWMSLEQLCKLAPVAKSTGLSLGVGVLFSPLLVAIPFFLHGCGWFPGSWVVPRNLEVLQSRAPVMDGIDLSAFPYLLGFFGFGMPALERFVPPRWVRWPIVLAAGTLFFADQTRVIAGPLVAALVAGLLTLAIFWFLWAQFDLLAVLVLQLSSGLLLSFLMLAQRGGPAWLVLMLLGSLVTVAWVLFRNGKTVAEGDPRASIPAVTGFRAEREKLRAEFSVARRAQQDMLPQTPPKVPGYSIAASCTPSLEVGGDLYDFLKLPDGRIGIGVADVSGKGVPAALYMTLTKGLLAAVTKDNSQLARVMEEVNRHLCGVTRKKVFVTMALGFLDPATRVLQCVRAGHNPIVWRQASIDSTSLVTMGGLGLGITPSRVFSTQLTVGELALAEGDAVVFYSDGITEAMNSELEQFGDQRLVEAVKRTDTMGAAAARDSILGEVKDFLGGVHPQDDMTLVVLRVEAQN